MFRGRVCYFRDSSFAVRPSEPARDHDYVLRSHQSSRLFFYFHHVTVLTFRLNNGLRGYRKFALDHLELLAFGDRRN
jgi:hypothetical protein